MKTGLVLEGGGMRGLYTNGVLDCLMDHDYFADYVIGVSAGACSGISYVSRQRGRSFRVNTGYLHDPRYVGLQSFFKTGSFFGMDFLFKEIPEKLEPFDNDTFYRSPTEYFVGVTDVETGKPAYYGKDAMNGDTTVIRASSSIPIFSPMVQVGGRLCLDGGVSDPIPVRRALADGCDRLIVVLTRDRSYQKAPESMRSVYRRVFRGYPAMIRALDQRHAVYNETLDLVRRLERQGIARVVAPSAPVVIGRFETNEARLESLYKDGMLDGQKLLARL